MKTVVIIGGTGGIGSGIVKKYCNENYNVIATYCKNLEYAKFLEEQYPENLKFYKLDLGSDEFYEDIKKISIPNKMIDVLVCTVGILEKNLSYFQTPEKYLNTMSINVIRQHEIINKFLLLLKASKKGSSIVLISSVASSSPLIGQLTYSSSKAALESMVKVLALELSQYNIRINGVKPGYIDTQMLESVDSDKIKKEVERIPLGRLGHSDDVSELVFFLGTNKSSYITGTNIVIDGGLTL